jgi:hypothetical protein
MDHVVYLDTKALEMENLISGMKTMVVRGAQGENYLMEGLILAIPYFLSTTTVMA